MGLKVFGFTKEFKANVTKVPLGTIFMNVTFEFLSRTEVLFAEVAFKRRSLII